MLDLCLIIQWIPYQYGLIWLEMNQFEYEHLICLCSIVLVLLRKMFDVSKKEVIQNAGNVLLHVDKDILQTKQHN